MRNEIPFEEANLLANIVMLTAISNQAVADYPPPPTSRTRSTSAARRKCAVDWKACWYPLRPSTPRFRDYKAFVAARAETLLAWANDLTGGLRAAEELGANDPEVILRGETGGGHGHQLGRLARHCVQVLRRCPLLF